MRRARLPALSMVLAAAACGGAESSNMTAGEVAAELRGLRVEPGLWEVTSAVLDARGENMPREARARIRSHRGTIRNCVTPAQAARPDANFMRIQQRGACTYRGFSIQGGRMRGEMRCTDPGLPGAMTTSMDGRYGPRNYEVRMRMVSTGMPEGANMIIDTRTVGRRIGQCPPDAPRAPKGGPS